MTAHPITDRLRGGLVGMLVAALAVAAHGVAGGGFPGSAGSTLLLLIAAATGAAAAAAPAFRHPVVVTGLLAAGQSACHAALSGPLGHHHNGNAGAAASFVAVPAGWMLVAHAVAALGCAALIALAERLYAAASRTVRAMIARPRAPRIHTVAHWSSPGLRPYRFPPNGAIGPRAPPVSARP